MIHIQCPLRYSSNLSNRNTCIACFQILGCSIKLNRQLLKINKGYKKKSNNDKIPSIDSTLLGFSVSNPTLKVKTL